MWQERIAVPCKVVVLEAPEGDAGPKLAGAACTGAAARLMGAVSREALERAVAEELGALSSKVVDRNLIQALDAFDRVAGDEGSVREGEPASADRYALPI